jgi:branched-chain amino acid transport system permease protein
MGILPCGVYFDSYRKDMAFLRTYPQTVSFAVFILVLIGLPWVLDIRYIAMITMASIISVAVLGLQITSGYAGQINLGQSAFMGMGAFVCGSLVVNFELPFWITIPAGGLGSAVLGALFGIPALRIKSFYLAMTTIAAQIVFPIMIIHLPRGWFGGAYGLSVEPAKLWGLTFNTDVSLYYLIVFVAVVMIFFCL